MSADDFKIKVKLEFEEKDLKDLQKKIQEPMKELGKSVKEVVPTGGKTEGLFASLKEISESAANLVGGVGGEVMHGLSNLFGQLFGLAGGAGGEKVAGGGVATTSLGVLAVLKVLETIKGIVETVLGFLRKASGVLNAAFELLGTTFRILIKPFADLIGFILLPIFAALLKYVIMPFYRDLLPLAKNLGKWVADKIVPWLEDNAPYITAIVDSLGTIALWGLGSVAAGVADLVKFLGVDGVIALAIGAVVTALGAGSALLIELGVIAAGIAGLDISGIIDSLGSISAILGTTGIIIAGAALAALGKKIGTALADWVNSYFGTERTGETLPGQRSKGLFGNWLANQLGLPQLPSLGGGEWNMQNLLESIRGGREETGEASQTMFIYPRITIERVSSEIDLKELEKAVNRGTADALRRRGVAR
jgi:hypothetical protein